MAEDMDLTWTLYNQEYKVRFVQEAVCYPIEPHDFNFLSKQLRRWSHGFVQNVRLHWSEVVHQPYLRSILAVGVWDATVASLDYLVLLPLLAIFVHPLFLLGYLIDLPAVAVPVISKGIQRGELGRVLLSLPCFVVMRLVISVFMLRAVWLEFVMGRTLLVYEKGHSLWRACREQGWEAFSTPCSLCGWHCASLGWCFARAGARAVGWRSGG